VDVLSHLNLVNNFIFENHHEEPKNVTWFDMKSSDAKASKCHLKFSSKMAMKITY